MNITLLNGASAGDHFVDDARDTIVSELEAQGHQITTWTPRDEQIAYCLGCFECWTKYPGLCRIDDTGRDVAESIIQSDAVIYLTPVTFGGYSTELKKVLDRNICLILPFFTKIDGEVHHKPRYNNYPSLLGIGVLPMHDPEQEQLFATLLNRNAINMHAPDNAAGFVYRNQGADSVRACLAILLDEIGLPQPINSLEETE